MRSRAVFLPRACCFWTAVSSAAETAAAARSRRSSRRWAVVSGRGGLVTGPPAAAWQSREDPGGEHGDTTLLIAAPDQAQAQDQGVWSEHARTDTRPARADDPPSRRGRQIGRASCREREEDSGEAER